MEPRDDRHDRVLHEAPPFSPLGLATHIQSERERYPEALREWADQIPRDLFDV